MYAIYMLQDETATFVGTCATKEEAARKMRACEYYTWHASAVAKRGNAIYCLDADGMLGVAAHIWACNHGAQQARALRLSTLAAIAALAAPEHAH